MYKVGDVLSCFDDSNTPVYCTVMDVDYFDVEYTYMILLNGDECFDKDSILKDSLSKT